ncbi:hypothetical protein J2Z69_002346 [Paenibacillus shirakamiensis]|uniref:Radical SAM protein n=1 Tax=Paenibacillus shirakamiensis TaxID=1265935 RepID=A0ABS4JHV4_9BACL|nr:hypothetical protein [Paenibacillus shirakamiensis]MBP2001303.1 hypothetical protein [Paenibacillus shirakamiensis]
MSVFVYNDRLGIEVPEFDIPFEQFPLQERLHIIEVWESIRGNIPSKIMDLEREIVIRLYDLGEEDNFEASCQINTDIAELASIINDLLIWYRVSADVTDEKRHL